MVMFRRNTHDRDGNYRTDIERMPATGDGYFHWLCTDKGMTFAAFCEAIERDDTNFYDPATYNEETGDYRIPRPTRGELALSLVAMVEAGIVEVVPDGWTR